jgi:hypothetical protein
MASGCRLHEIDEIPTGVFEKCHRDRSHARRLAAKFDAAGLEALCLGGYVLRDEGGGRDSGGKINLLQPSPKIGRLPAS